MTSAADIRIQYKGVLFDLDGTLYNDLLAKLLLMGLNPRFFYVAKVLGEARDHVREQEPRPHESLYPYIDDVVANRLKVKVQDAVSMRHRLQQHVMPSMIKKVGCYQRLPQFLDAITTSGMKIGVLSDDRPNEKLNALGLASYPWEIVQDLNNIGCLKPQPLGFKEACEAMNLKESSVLFVGDKDKLDGRGAESAGMDVMIKRKGRWAQSKYPSFWHYGQLL